MAERRRDFCIECRKETEYILQKKDIVKKIKDKNYTFTITIAVCMECGEEIYYSRYILGKVGYQSPLKGLSVITQKRVFFC